MPAVAFEDPRLLSSDIRVLGSIGSFLNRDYEAWPSQALIAKRARLDRKTVNKSIKKLIAYGYVRAEAKYPKAKMKSVMNYRVIMDEDVRIPADLEQPDLFQEEDYEAGESPAISDGENFPIETTGAKIPAIPDGASGDPIDGVSRDPNVGASGDPNSKNITSRTSPDSSVSYETAAKPEKGSDEDDLDEPPSQPSRNELLKRLIFATGVPLLVGQGMRDQAARGFLGSLVKTANLEIVSRVLQRAANDPPIDAKAWLRASVLSEAKRVGIRVDLPTTPAQAAVQAEEDLAMWERRCEHLAKTGQWRPNWGQDPRGGVPDGMPIEFYDRFGIDKPGRRASQRSVQPQPIEANP